MEETRIFTATERAMACGFWPALLSAETDWERVLAWAERAADPDFVWEKCDGWRHEPIIVGPATHGRTAIHAGQCRILGGLLAGKPVPEALFTRLGIEDPTRPWGSPTCEVALESLLPMDRPDQSWAGPCPAWLNRIGVAQNAFAVGRS